MSHGPNCNRKLPLIDTRRIKRANLLHILDKIQFRIWFDGGKSNAKKNGKAPGINKLVEVTKVTEFFQSDLSIFPGSDDNAW